MSRMKSYQMLVPVTGGLESTNSLRENCCRNKRKFLLETTPSLRNTVQGSMKLDKQSENGEDLISNSNSLQSLHYASNSGDSDNLQCSYQQNHTSSIGKTQAQKLEAQTCHHTHYIADQDTGAEIPVEHGQLPIYLEAQVGNWDDDTEHQLEELLMKYLESICNNAMKKVVSYGYDVDEAREAVLRVASSFTVSDSLSSFGEKALVYLSNKSESHETDTGLSDFKELHKFMLAEMVRVLKDVRHFHKEGDALWCLIVNDMNMSHACGVQDLISSSTDGSSSFDSPSVNSLPMLLPSAEACLPTTVSSLELQCNAPCQPLNNIATKAFVHHVANANAGVQLRRTVSVQPSYFSKDISSDVSVALSNERSQSSTFPCIEKLGKDHKDMPVPVNSDVVSPKNLPSQTSLCTFCSACCHEDTNLSIGPPVRLVTEPCSFSKNIMKGLAGSPVCKEDGKKDERWQMSSPRSVGQPTISKTQQNSLFHFGELSMPLQCTSSSSSCKFDLDHIKQKHLVRGASHPINQNARSDRLQSSVVSGKMSQTSSPRACNPTQPLNGRVKGCSLTAAGKELSLAIASGVQCSKMDAHLVLRDEPISDIMNLQKELDISVVPGSKDQLLEELLQRVKDLEVTLQERSKWAREKVAHAAKRLINDFSELKTLRSEREEVSRLKKEKQALEDASKKKILDMETAFRKAIGQAECTNAAVRRLEIENAEMRAEMEASKLSAAESAANDKVVAKTEKQARKKEKAWEKQRAKLQEELTLEKRKLAELQLDLLLTKEQQQAAEEKWKQEVKAKEVAIKLEESERRAKEQVEAAAKKNEDSIKRKAKANDRRYQDDIARLEEEIAHLSLSRHSLMQNVGIETNTGVTLLNKYTESMQELRNVNNRLLQELADVQSPSNRELHRDRECIMCMSEERSVVFLPCAHQVICADCNNLHETQGMKDCPSCRTSIEQRIKVYGTNAQ